MSRLAALRRRLATLRADERGASLVEFALFIPILSMMMMGISDFAMGYSAKLRVEAAAYRTLEKAAMGTATQDFSYMRAEAAGSDGAGGIEVAEVSVDTWLECNRVRSTAGFNANCPTGEDAARYVSITVTDTYVPTFNYGPLLGNTSGVVPLTATAALRLQ